MGSPKLIGICRNESVLYLHGGSHCPEALQMKVDRTTAYIAASRKRNLGMLVFAKQCSQKIIRSSYLLYILIINAVTRHRRTVYPDSVCIHPVYHRTYAGDSVYHHINIFYIRQILYRDSLIRHDCRRKYSKSRIFSAADLDLSNERRAPLNYILLHDYLTFSN